MKFIFVTFALFCNGIFVFGLFAKKSCLEHYLNGEFELGVKSIQGDDGRIYEIDCVAPNDGESDQFVQTKVHTALEQWMIVESGKRSTIGFQIADRKILRRLIESSENCIQEVFVKWPKMVPFDPTKEPTIMGFTIESIQGVQRVFQRNSSIFESYEEAISLQSFKGEKEAGVLHVLGTDARDSSENKTAWIKSGPLICKQKIVEKVECLFELNDRNDWLKIASSTKTGRIEFSFRTDKSESPFMKIFLTDGSSINIDLLDGYLLTVDHMVHPAKLLADGNWHTVRLDVASLTLQIDGSLPIISFAAISEGNPFVELQILLNGQISAIRVGESNTWLCSDSNAVEKRLTEQILRKICPSYEDNYCKCLAPKSVLNKNVCKTVDGNNGFQLARKSDQLAFFYFRGFSEKSRINVIFKSDSESGLIVFGIVNTKISQTRIQIHFNGDKMFASQCARLPIDLNEKCRSCSIRKINGFSNDWVHVSFFHYNDYQFLAVDSAVCRLTPEISASAEAQLLDGATLYEADSTAESALFVGGTYYTKTRELNTRINDLFRKKFLDHTREKPPSLRGCIAQIIFNGEIKDLRKVFEDQVALVSKKNEQEIFSMKAGCPNCRVPIEYCGGAKCRSPMPNLLNAAPICDCSSIFAIQDSSTGRCLTNLPASAVGSLGGYGNLLLTSPTHVFLDRVSFTNSGKNVLSRIWMLLRFPESNDEPEVIFTLGLIHVRVGNFGKKVVIHVENFKEEFDIFTNDERLHLIALQRISTMETTSDANVKIQVDNQIRIIDLEEIPILGTSKVELSPIIARNEEEYKFPGCLAELSVSFDYRDNIKRPGKENRAFQVDLLQQIVGDTFDSSDPIETSLIQKSPCGIRDPSFWTSNSSEYGIVGLYDPYGDGNHVSSLSIIVTILVSLLIITILVFYCYCRQKKSEKYRLNTSKYPPTIGKEEKQLLKHGYMNTSGTSTEHSHVDLGDGLSPISIKKPLNGHTKPIPVFLKHETAIPKFEPLKIEQLPGSPRRVTRPITKRVPPPPDYSPLHRPPNLPRILSSSKPVVLAAQRAPIASTHVDDL